MRSLVITALLTSTLAFTHAQAQEVSLSTPTLRIDRVIRDETMAPLLQHMILLTIQPKVPEVIQLVIDSPGGSVTTGFRFVSLMHALQGRGTKFVCYVPSLAASMAFHILLSCDERYALNEAGLLWHRGRVSMGGGAAVTGPELLRIGSELADLDASILRDVTSKLHPDMSKQEIVYHFESQTLHQASVLHRKAPHFVIARKHIPGLFEALFDPSVVSTVAPSRGLFDFRSGEMVYVYMDDFLLGDN